MEFDFIKQISGHSRIEVAAQDLPITPASLTIIMKNGRWSKDNTLMRCVQSKSITN